MNLLQLLLVILSSATLRLSTGQLVRPVRRYISEDGTDLDQCGQTSETACKTITPILKQIHTLDSFVSPDLLHRVEDVWRKILEKHKSSTTLGTLLSQLLQVPTLPPASNTSNLMTPLITPFPSFNFPTVSPLDVELCTQDGLVNYNFIDDPCQEIKDICLSYIASQKDREYFSHNLDSFCLERKNIYVDMMSGFCNFTDHVDIFREQFVKKIHEEFISQLNSLMVEIYINTNIDLTNERSLDLDTHYYYNLHIIPTGNRTLHIDILNSNFYRVHLYLDNKNISAQIKDNVFVEAGVTISSTRTHTHRSVVFQNNNFQGNNSKTVLEIRDTTNVYIYSTVFRNIFRPITFENLISGMLCHNSQIEIQDILFQNVPFFPVFEISNSTLAIQNLEISDTDFNSFSIHFYLPIPLLYIKHSEGVVKKSHFQNNTYAVCFDVRDGNVTFQNMNVVDNSKGSVGSISDAVANVYNASIFNNEGVIFTVTKSTMIIDSCKFRQNSHINSHPILRNSHLELFESHISIIDSIFKGNTGNTGGQALIYIGHKSEAFITRSNFVFNRNINYLIYIDSTSEEKDVLKIVSCRFERNMYHKSLIDTNLGHLFIYDTTFDHNQNVIDMSKGSADFTNSIFTSNYGSMAKVFFGSLWFINCSFSNNIALSDASILSASYSQIVLIKCTVVNNSASFEAGAIHLKEHSSLQLERSTFKNNSCGIEGGAVSAYRNSSLNISHSIFKINKALGADGGAIFLQDESSLVSHSCWFIGNTAALGGGAVMVVDHSSYADTGSTFMNNTAADNGGAVSVHDHSVFNSSNTTFTGNKAESLFDINSPHCPQGLAYENDGGAIMLETYSSATITDCSFERNKASDDGGAIYGRRRSQIRIKNSSFQFNYGQNSGGSILVQHSLVVIISSTFKNDSCAMGYGGSISAEHVGNVTIDNCLFINCTAEYGGSVSVRAESILVKTNSFTDSCFSNSNGGSLFVSKSFVEGYNVTVKNCRSTLGAGIFVHDSSKIFIREFHLEANKCKKSGGTVYCVKSKMRFENGSVKLNNAKSTGGAVFAETCQVIFNNVTFVNNTAEMSGGAIYAQSSNIDIHNSDAKHNSAHNNGEFAMITSKSKLQTNYLTLFEGTSNSIIITKSSEAELTHVRLSHGNYYCAITVLADSHIHLAATTEDKNFKSKNVCLDNSSSVEGTPTGIFPDSCKAKCRCYSDYDHMALVADCSYSGLISLPESLPEHTDWLLFSGNNLTSLTIQNPQQTEILKNLSELDFYNNKIRNISSQFWDMFIKSHNLLYLNLSKNELITLPKSIQNISSLQNLKITGNQFKCSCENMWMKDWFLNETDLIEDYESVLCQMASGKWIPIVKMDKADLGCVLNEEAFSIWMITIISLAAILIAVAVAVIAKKWDLINFWLFLKFGIRFKEKTDNIEMANLDYDAFINYNVSDHEWVREQVIRLFQDHNYKLCLHTRDFVPTATIQHNINLSIKHSRRMVSVVTRNYLDSGWCKEEFSQGHLEAVEGRHRFIILIMVDDIPVKDLPDEMQKYVKTYTYIDATKLNNDKEVALFNKKLLYVMPKKPIREFNIERNDDYN